MTSAPNSAGTYSASCPKVSRRRARKLMPPLGERVWGWSVACPALAIEDDAPVALRADQPLAPSRVAKSERATAQAACGEQDEASRTFGAAVSAESLADRALLGGVELGVAAHRLCPQSSDTTTFPNCSPLMRRS